MMQLMTVITMEASMVATSAVSARVTAIIAICSIVSAFGMVCSSVHRSGVKREASVIVEAAVSSSVGASAIIPKIVFPVISSLCPWPYAFISPFFLVSYAS